MSHSSESIPTSILRRHAAFWRNEPSDTPLIRTGTYIPLGRGGLSAGAMGDFSDNARVDPVTLVDELSQVDLPEKLVDADLISCVTLPGMCWTEGVAGCQISMGEGGAWADRAVPDEGSLDERLISFLEMTDDLEHNLWLHAFRACTLQLVKLADGRFAVAQPLLRGPLDMMASAIGHEEMVTACIDNAVLADRVLARCTDLFIRVASTHFDLAPVFDHGSVMFGMLNDRATVRTQLDNSVLLSPSMYGEQISVHYRRIFEAFPSSIIHLHSGALHIIDKLLDEKGLTAIQVSRDWPAGPSIQALIPVFQKIQERKPFVLTGPVSSRDLELLKSELNPTGLCLDVQLTD